MSSPGNSKMQDSKREHTNSSEPRLIPGPRRTDNAESRAERNAHVTSMWPHRPPDERRFHKPPWIAADEWKEPDHHRSDNDSDDEPAEGRGSEATGHSSGNSSGLGSDFIKGTWSPDKPPDTASSPAAGHKAGKLPEVERGEGVMEGRELRQGVDREGKPAETPWRSVAPSSQATNSDGKVTDLKIGEMEDWFARSENFKERRGRKG
ncbi:hypothetical protein IMSHALPRED_006845 [Imshaugia aleurites]|uniref:Uncharacterized protein n=1 Tax=Imshaugia aleurites TaxID=172621 RepID=A0A8H3FQG6_9LECA|nr:hypothetical protein IMSHALPRED_006845 [Imshaugia aleurites]